MATSAFVYRCPNTGLRIQAIAAAEEITDDEHTFEPVTCVMCQQVHVVNLFTGKLLGEQQGATEWKSSGNGVKLSGITGISVPAA